MSPQQRKTRAGMLSNRVGGRFEGSLTMTAFTAVSVRLPSELGSVDVLVACNTGKLLNAIDNYSPLRCVALRALYLEMTLLQWKQGIVMLRHAKDSMSEVLLNGVALVTIAAPSVGGKLAAVRISMAVSAACECKRLFEVAVEVTRVARDFGVFP